MSQTLDEFRSEHWLFSDKRFDRQLAADFLFLFSRAEYALKAADFKRPVGNTVWADWETFALSLPTSPATPAGSELDKAVRYLKNFPPLTATLTGKGLGLQETKHKALKQTSFLLDAVSDVRNNLFHGGKDFSGSAAERDRNLIKAASVVLLWALRADPKVWSYFDERGPG